MAERRNPPRATYPAPVRCAIYTRKSSDEGLDQAFNSLDAQREACAAYIASQQHEGWIALTTGYDDGGVSGATLARPALQRLLADIEAGRVDILVVYKVDRLTRALSPPPPSPADARTPGSLGGGPEFFCGYRAISTVAGAAPRRRDTSGARWRRYAGDRLASRFPWSGWGARESLPGHPSHGRRIGPRHGPILSPSPSVVAPARVASRGHPGLSRVKFL